MQEFRRLFDELRRIPPVVAQQFRQRDPQLAEILDRNDFSKNTKTKLIFIDLYS